MDVPYDSYVTSPFFSPTILGGIRFLYGLYALVTLVLYIVFGWKGTNEDASSFFAIFAILSYFGVIAYFLTTGVHTFLYSRGRFPLAEWARPLQFMHVWLLSSIVSFPLIITAMYYQVFEFDPVSTIDSLCYISMHGINAAFSLFEVFLTNAPPGPWRLLGLNLLLILGYVGIAYITRDTKGFNDTFLAAYLAILFASEVIAFAVLQLIMIGRRWAMDKLGWTNRFVYKNGFQKVNTLTNECIEV
ncbi:hypothetical protein CPB85DRAFT_1342836 [Mucidula mucida]|nr:hypothetical protein CPB85DRAFT_1342836 [Mucidula mucida]